MFLEVLHFLKLSLGSIWSFEVGFVGGMWFLRSNFFLMVDIYDFVL